MHHHRHGWDQNWRRWEAMARRGFGRFGNFNINMQGGDWSGFGNNFRIGRMLASGDLRLVALFFIEQQPRHGYDLIKAIEEKSAGFYSPSPGIVYPALTFLEEAGYVTSATEGNKKLYTITDEGRAHLADNREAIESTLDFLGKAGAQMQAWREKMQGEGGWPFGERGEPGPRPGFEDVHDAHHAHHHGPHPGPGPHWRRHDRPDRDMDDVPPEVNAARKALKRAIKDALRRGPGDEVRIAQVLERAAAEIRNGAGDVQVDIERD